MILTTGLKNMNVNGNQNTVILATLKLLEVMAMDILTDTAGAGRKKEKIKMFLLKKGEWLSVSKDFENLKNNILFREVCDTDQMKNFIKSLESDGYREFNIIFTGKKEA